MAEGPRSEASHRERSRDRLQQLLETIPHGVQETDTGGTITYANPAHHRMYGYGPGELIGRSIYDLTAPGPAREELRKRLPILVREQPPPEPWTRREVRRDGSRFDVRVDWDYRRDDSGRLVGFAAVLTDVTRLGAAEAQVREQEAHLQSLLESARDFALYRLRAHPGISHSGEVVLVSPSLGPLLGTTEPENFAAWFANIHPDDLARVEASNRRSAETGEPFDEVMRLRLPGSDDVRWVRAISHPVMGPEGRPSHFNGLIVDLTRQQQAEEARQRLEDELRTAQKLESLGLLAGGIAHDFNNFLMAIIGNAELALPGLPEGTPERRHVRDIETAARRAAELTRQLLTVSGRDRLALRPLDVNELIRETVDLLRASIGRDARIRFDLAPSLPPVAGDEGQLRRVVINLVRNSAEALGGSPGEVTLRTDTRQVDERAGRLAGFQGRLVGGPHVVLEVADNGRGMDERTAGRVFEPFFTTKSAGRGLGLATVLGIVRAHHGAIGVDSRPGAGTRVRVLLPASAD